MNPLVFVVDDDADARANLRDILELHSYDVEEAGAASELFALSGWNRVAVVLLDRKLPDGTPESVLPEVRRRAPTAGVVIVTGYGDLESAVACLRDGARDYIIKPINAEALLVVVARELERQRSMQQLADSKKWRQALFENAIDGFLILDAEWKILEANQAACTILGENRAEMCGRRLQEFLGKGEQTIQLPGTQGDQQRVAREGTLIAKDSRPIQIEYRLVTNFSPGLQMFSFHDVTDRKRAEERARQAERLAAIGETMTALVHESRNALQRTSNCLEMLELQLEGRPEAMELLSRAGRAQQQISQLFEEIREWAAPISVRRERTNLAEVWRDAWRYAMQARPGPRPRLQESIDCEPLCEADRLVMEQVFRNVFENAIEAMPAAGSVYVRCSRGPMNGHDAMRITIRDEGPGLTPEQQTRIFEPFFTTKRKGTGLGMALCQRIVQAHDGAIIARSPGGAQIEITLPIGVQGDKDAAIGDSASSA